MPRSRKPDSATAVPGDTGTLSDLGLTGHTVSRRTMMKAGLGVAAGAGLAATVGAATAPPAHAGLGKLAKATNVRPVGSGITRKSELADAQFTGHLQTGTYYGVNYTDLCIPVELRDGSLLFIGGDSYGAAYGPQDGNDWRSPVGLRSHTTNSRGRAVIDGAVTDTSGHAKALVPQDHTNKNTTLPTDVFRIPETNALYMHIVKGPLYNVTDSQFWTSTDDGNNWRYLRGWPGSTRGGWFQQKSYAVPYAQDPYVYCVTTIFNRGIRTGMHLFRIFKRDLNITDAQCNASPYKGDLAYQAWGFANGQWNWGNLPTSITEERNWGEICFRAMGGKYVLSWYQPVDPPRAYLGDIRAMVFPTPTSNLITTTEQTMVYQDSDNPSSDSESVQEFCYGGFIFPRSTFDNFNIAVSNWDQGGQYYPGDEHNYCVSQWRATLNPNI